MTDLKVDLYSDTVTRPSPAMRRAMAEAEVGNEQAFEDPTVNRLCAMTAELLGKEAAVFMPSGTMCNQISFRVHCQTGDEIVMDRTAHPINYEAGGPAALAGALVRTLDGVRGIFTAEQVRAAIREPGRHSPRSRVLEVENTANLGGGTVWPVEQVAAVTAVAREAGMLCHLDGARLLNAVVASGVPARDYARHFDSVWLDLSKGLGCPIGAVLAGSADFIEQAWRFKQQFGGAMRQAGIVAAAGVYALEHNVERLAEDHENARHLARLLAQLPGIVVDLEAVQSNMVYLDVAGSGLSARQVHDRLRAKGVRIGVTSATLMRAVTHLDVDRAGIETAARALSEVLADAG